MTLKKLLSFGFRMLFALTGIGLLAQLFKICTICDNFPRSILKDHRNDNKTLLLRSAEALHHHIFSMVYNILTDQSS